MRKFTAIAPTNIAFIKYMGKDPRGDALSDGQGLNLPENGSISMCLDALHSKTTVEFGDFPEDTFTLDGITDAREAERAFAHVNIVRAMAGISDRVRVVSTNSFGKSRGLSSSASGHAALAVAAANAAGLTLTTAEMSSLARKGSGSASRSVPDGFVEWCMPEFSKDGTLSKDSTAHSLYPPEYWDIADVVVVTGTPAKKVSTTLAHVAAGSCAYHAERLQRMPEKLARCRAYLHERNFTRLGELVEEESLDLHKLFILSGIVYLQQQTLDLMQHVALARRAGLEAYLTLNTGQDGHVLCLGSEAQKVKEFMLQLPCVQDVIINHPGRGARLMDEHLF